MIRLQTDTGLLLEKTVLVILATVCCVTTSWAQTPTPTPIAKALTYTVMYDGNGNTGGSAPVDPNSPYNGGSLVGVLGPGSLVKADYMFTGWNTLANGSGTHYTPAQAFIINADTTLYAQWVVPPCAPAGLDPSFDGDGKVTTVLGSDDAALSVATQPDGKIVAAGYSDNGSNTDFALVRYNPDGSLDTSFGGTGKVTTAVLSSNDFAHSVAIQPDGKIVAAGDSYNGANYDFALVRYNVDGSLDTSFGGTGKVTTAVLSSSDVANSVAIQPDGKIVAAGYSYNGSNNDFALVRYNPDGSLDTSFGGTGKVTTAVLSDFDLAKSVAIQPDGKIIAAGYSWNGSNIDFALVRYNPNGSLDPSFGGTGKVTTAVLSSNDYAHSVAIQPDGKIVAAGQSWNGSNTDFALVRYNPNGSLDPSFGGTGKVTTAVLSSDDGANSVAIQPNGKIVAAGDSRYNGEGYVFALVRYNADGSLDTSFGGTGKVTTAVLSFTDQANSVAIQPDGKIIAAGGSFNSGSNNDEFALVRYGSPCFTPSPTPTATATATASPTPPPSPTATATATATPTATASPTPTPTPTPCSTTAPWRSDQEVPDLQSMSGTVVYCSNPVPAPVPGVTILLNYLPYQTTNSNGQYGAVFKAGCNNCRFTPSIADRTPASPGIDTIDVLAVQRHFLSIGPPLSGCRLTAADVNGDAFINSIDVIAIQRFILGFFTGIANVGKYQFTPHSRCFNPQPNQNFDTLVFGDVAAPFIY